jgi:replicative DNA helicase
MSQIEKDFLGSVIWSGLEGLEVIDKEQISADSFLENDTRKVFLAIQELRAKQEPISSMTVSTLLPQDKKDLPFSWTDATGSPAFYAAHLKKEHQRRALVELSQQLKAETEKPEPDLEKAIDKALASISQIQDKGFTNTSVTLREAAAQLVDTLDQPPRFIPTPWPALNELIGGLRPGALYVIGGRPGKGKSMIALQLATAIAVAERPVAFFSLEMGALELAARALSAETQIPLGKIDTKQLSEDEKKRLSVAHTSLASSLYLEASSGRKVTELRPSLRQIRATAGAMPVAVFVDYLQLLEAEGSSLYERVTAISKQLKSLAMELDVPIIALAQLNRQAENRSGAPSLADLRDSGAIEQDADAVLLLSEDSLGRLVISIQKNRQGALGSLTGELRRSTMTLEHLVKD